MSKAEVIEDGSVRWEGVMEPRLASLLEQPVEERAASVAVEKNRGGRPRDPEFQRLWAAVEATWEIDTDAGSDQAFERAKEAFRKAADRYVESRFRRAAKRGVASQVTANRLK